MMNHDERVGLGQLNLNLLPALDALLRERSVSAAARRMHVSQSAMSHSLAKLRLLLGDPLLVASGRAMALTPRGEQLADELPQALAALQRALDQPQPFAPKTSTHVFRIATFDYFGFTTLPEVLTYLQRHAPGINLHIERLGPDSTQRLVDGKIDFILGAESMQMPSTLMHRFLYRDPFSVIARAGHPQVNKRLSLERYLALKHVLVSVEGRTGLVDRVLDKRDLSRDVALVVAHFASAALAVSASDMVCTIASTVAHRAKQLHGVQVLSPPLELPSAGLSAWWPRQHHNAPASQWFRSVFFDGTALSPQLRKLIRAGVAAR